MRPSVFFDALRASTIDKVNRQRMVANSPPAQDTMAMLAQAVRTAQGGDLLAARKMAESALAQTDATTNIGPVHAFLGMVVARLGDLDGAATHLHQAHKALPNDVTIACNLISILLDLTRHEEALAVATRDLAVHDPSLRVARYRAFLAQELERFPEAVEAYRMVLDKFPNDFECRNNLGNALAGIEDFEGAVAELHRAMEIDPQSAPTRLNLASALQALEQNEEAEQLLLQTSREFPEDSQPPYQLYILYKNLARQQDAIEQLELAAQRQPDLADLQLKLGIEYGVVRRTVESEKAYRRCLALNPAELEAYLGLAIQYEHTNREEMFAPLIEEARANGVVEKSLAFIEALEARRKKDFELALEKLALVSPEVEPIRTTHIRATVLDRLGRTDEAFAGFCEANKLLEESPAKPRGHAKELRARLRAEIATLTPLWRDSWQPQTVSDKQIDPVFLVGFPRSGTTLLDTILMGHPDTVVMEEQPPLNIVEDSLGGLAALPNLDQSAVREARARYFAEVRNIQPLADGQTLVDKSPLFLYRLPLIKRLFPDAKIILALRHPCDVVLSCLMSNFRLNQATSNFLRLADATEFYDLSFRHWTKSQELIEASVHTIMYERLVEDVEAEVRPLIDWLGLSWEPSLLDHTRTAKARGLITTASYSQVAEPIYKRASGRWERYREHLLPAIETLAPWAIEFGYPDPRIARASS